MSAADKQLAFEDWQAKQSGWEDSDADAYTGETVELTEPVVSALAGTEKKRRSYETQQLKGRPGQHAAELPTL